MIKRGRSNREKRREAAYGRMEDKADITPQEQLEVLDNRLGRGVGATKERARLAKRMGK